MVKNHDMRNKLSMREFWSTLEGQQDAINLLIKDNQDMRIILELISYYPEIEKLKLWLVDQFRPKITINRDDTLTTREIAELWGVKIGTVNEIIRNTLDKIREVAS